MNLPNSLHSWDITPKDAVAIQRDLASEVRIEPLNKDVRYIAGVDVSIRGSAFQTAIAVVSFPDIELVEQATFRGTVTFPYIPGLLSFREMPAILPALEKLQIEPDVFMTDSQGYAHPRRFGLACHLGVWFDRPAFGVAKTRFIGQFEELPPEKGARAELIDRDELVGIVLRTRTRIKPVFVSVGHRITLEEAVRLTQACTTRYKLPEPTRWAHRLSKKPLH